MGAQKNPHVSALLDLMASLMRGEPVPPPGTAEFDRVSKAAAALVGLTKADRLQFSSGMLAILDARLKTEYQPPVGPVVQSPPAEGVRQ